MENNFQNNKKGVVYVTGGGNRITHYPGKWIVSVHVRTDHQVQP
jgi:hypothetical protein